MSIDLNCDLGEGASHDAELMPLVSSANIACGAHAGDEETMRRTIALALRHGVAIGAHPGYADRENFGRTEQNLPPAAVGELVRGQLIALQRLAAEQGAALTHVKPHGALYNQAARDPALADAIAAAVAEVDPSLVLFGLAGSHSLAAAEARGLATASEVFADRTYRPDGSLTPRTQPGALIDNAAAACAQALRLARDGLVRTTDGREIPLRADTVCLHGDGPHAVAFALCLRNALASAGIEVRATGGRP